MNYVWPDRESNKKEVHIDISVLVDCILFDGIEEV